MSTSFLILAAGQSKRMQTDKALLDYHGEPWIHRQVREVLSSRVVDQVVIVDQPAKKPTYETCLADFSQVKFVDNPVANSAPADSILVAFQSFVFPKGVFISPIDVPFEAGIIFELSQKTEKSSWVVKPGSKSRGGHPVWLSAEAVLNFKETPQRLDHWIRSLPKKQVQMIEFPQDVMQLNLNTPEDWQQFLNPEKERPKA